MKTYTYLEMLGLMLKEKTGMKAQKFAYTDEIGRTRTIWRDLSTSSNAFVEGYDSGHAVAYRFSEADLTRTYTLYMEPEIGPETDFSKAGAKNVR